MSCSVTPEMGMKGQTSTAAATGVGALMVSHIEVPIGYGIYLFGRRKDCFGGAGKGEDRTVGAVARVLVEQVTIRYAPDRLPERHEHPGVAPLTYIDDAFKAGGLGHRNFGRWGV